jgi:hypothetical protein
MNKELLDELFTYNLDTGIVNWKSSRSNRIKVGDIVGYKTPYGYLQVRLEGKLWMLHRLIWMIQTGKMPCGEIDHKDGQRDNNSWDNLRDVSKYTNMQNRKRADKDSLTGVLGVCFDKQSGKFRAQLIMNKVKILNKLFNTAEEASNAYKEAKENYYHFRS